MAKQFRAASRRPCAGRGSPPASADPTGTHTTRRELLVRELEAKKSDPMLYSIAFLAVILVIGCGVLGGLYLVCRHARPHEEKPAKKLPMSNLK